MGVSWKVGDKIGAVSQLNAPRVLMRPGTVTEIHDDGITVQWPGERTQDRYRWVMPGTGLDVERMA